MQRIILHCDLNNFFATATLTLNPTLKNLPVAICGDAKKRHGIVLAKNTIAKKYGVLTGETIWEAKRKCADLVILAPDYNLYENLSKKVRQIYLDYSDLVESFGIDECWVEITNPNIDFKKGEEIANEIRQRVKKELNLTVSVGVSFSKSLAKLGSDMKKPDAVTVIAPEDLKDMVWPLSCSELLMVGRATKTTLRSMGIFTIGDLAQADEKTLSARLGKNGVSLKKVAMGEETDKVTPYHLQTQPKSIGHSATAEKDLTTEEEVFAAILEFSETISVKLRQDNLFAGSVVFHYLTNEFEGQEFRAPLTPPTDLSMVIAKSAMELFKKNDCLKTPLRAVGVRVVNLTNKTEPSQLSLFDDEKSNDDSIEKNLIDIREKYGKNSIKRAVCMKNKAKPSSPGFYK